MEIWKDVVGFETEYAVSNIGRIKGKKRDKIRTLSEKKDGYLEVALSQNNKKKFLKAHRVVAEAFIPNPLNLPVVNHKNGIKTDNRVENLEWCTPSDNTLHAYRELNATRHNGGMNKEVSVFLENGELFKEFSSVTEVAEYFNTSRLSVREAIKRKSKTGKTLKGYKIDYSENL